MTETVECPANGCDFTGLPSAVAGHYGGKRDDAHAGGYQTALDMLDGGESSESDGLDDGPSTGAGGSKPARAGSGGDNPAMSSPTDTEAAASATVSTDGGASEPTCPECGGSRYFDASGHTEYDFGCADCSDGSGWVVWNE